MRKEWDWGRAELVKAQAPGTLIARTTAAKPKRYSEVWGSGCRNAKIIIRSVASLLPKPYPEHEAVANAYRLCCSEGPGDGGSEPWLCGDLRLSPRVDNWDRSTTSTSNGHRIRFGMAHPSTKPIDFSRSHPESSVGPAVGGHELDDWKVLL